MGSGAGAAPTDTPRRFRSGRTFTRSGSTSGSLSRGGRSSGDSESGEREDDD